MTVEINKLFEILLYGQKVGFDCGVSSSLRSSPKTIDRFFQHNPALRSTRGGKEDGI